MEPLIQRLPPFKRAASLTEAEARQALRCLHEFSYYPIPDVLGQDLPSKTQDAVLDSGYVSETDADEISNENKAISLYLEPLERDFAVRWLTGFVGQAWELSLHDDPEMALLMRHVLYCRI